MTKYYKSPHGHRMSIRFDENNRIWTLAGGYGESRKGQVGFASYYRDYKTEKGAIKSLLKCDDSLVEVDYETWKSY